MTAHTRIDKAAMLIGLLLAVSTIDWLLGAIT